MTKQSLGYAWDIASAARAEIHSWRFAFMFGMLVGAAVVRMTEWIR